MIVFSSQNMKTVMLLLIAISAILNSCNHKENNLPHAKDDHSTMEKMPLDTINFLLKLIKQNGDTLAYKRLSLEYYYFHKEEQLLYHAMIMANKYNYGYACAHVADLLLSINQENIQELDSKTRKLAIYYALRAQELGYEIKVNPEYKPIIDTLPKSSVYLNL
jgi:hypothetical protein